MDYCPLRWLQAQKDPRRSFASWLIELHEILFHIQYRPGRENVVADYLTQKPNITEDLEQGWIYRDHGMPRIVLTDK